MHIWEQNGVLVSKLNYIVKGAIYHIIKKNRGLLTVGEGHGEKANYAAAKELFLGRIQYRKPMVEQKPVGVHDGHMSLQGEQNQSVPLVPGIQFPVARQL